MHRQVLDMLTEAKRMLDDGDMSEAEMDHALSEYCQVLQGRSNPCISPSHHADAEDRIMRRG